MRCILAVVALSLLTAQMATAQQEDVLFLADFEDGTDGFITVSPDAELSTTRDPDLVFAGEGALQLDYVQRPAQPAESGWGFPGALFTLFMYEPQVWSEISFALASHISTPVVVALIENDDGPRYNCLLWCAAGTWNEYSLAPEDFTIDRDGPPDPNGRFDPDLVSALAIIDGDGFLRMLAEQSPLFYLEPPAEQTLWLDEFVVRAGEAETALAPEGPVPLVSYSSPLRGFMVLGGRDVAVTSEEQDDGLTALRLDYTSPVRTLFVVAHTLKSGVLEGADAIRFHARTNRKLTLVVSLDERRGPGESNKSSYYTSTRLEPADDFTMITLPLSLFQLGEDQTDPDGALNPELVETLSVVDGTAAIENSEVVNTLWLKAPVVVE